MGSSRAIDFALRFEVSAKLPANRSERALWSHCVMDFPSSLIQSLRAARRIVALTGAGISAESGLATFRDAQTGLWTKFKPEELATPDAFRRNPKLVSDWYAWRRGQALKAEPNAGHRA